ncbi:MAG: hypothetical protein CL609_06285 [Anaerolineaceae bacterium]|nr:hypothetical protein [Anaerolineaceae bacterium]
MEIRFTNIVKGIKSDIALAEVDLVIPGTGVTGILGDYGSGKSTVLSLITGYQKPDSGEIYIDQKKTKFNEVRDAVKLGIGSVDPNLNVYNKFSIRQNLLLNPDFKSNKQTEIESIFSNLCKQLDLSFEFDDLLGNYPDHIKLLFEIIRLFSYGFKLIVLDEPFKYFPEDQFYKLKNLFEILTQKEIQFVFSTQVKKEILFVCDTCIFIEKGKIIGHFQQPYKELDEIYKNELSSISLPKFSEINLLTLNDFQIYPNEDVINYNLRAGEIVGVYSENENFARDLLLCCAGLQTAERGELLLNGFDLFGRPLQEFINDGVVYIAEDHLEGNLIPDMPLFEHFGLIGDFSEPTFQPQKYRSETTKQLRSLGIHQELDTSVKNLSKKDQIKFLINILPKTLSLLIGINPTSGLDRETKQWVWQEIQQRSKSGIGVLVFSTEKEELLHNTHTIWVNRDGKWLEPFESSLLMEKYNQPIEIIDEENHADR